MRALFGTFAAAMLAVIGLIGAVGQADLTRQFAEASKTNPNIPELGRHVTLKRHDVPVVAGWYAER